MFQVVCDQTGKKKLPAFSVKGLTAQFETLQQLTQHCFDLNTSVQSEIGSHYTSHRNNFVLLFIQMHRAYWLSVEAEGKRGLSPE